jgi:hypothetical protein
MRFLALSFCVVPWVHMRPEQAGHSSRSVPGRQLVVIGAEGYFLVACGAIGEGEEP